MSRKLMTNLDNTTKKIDEDNEKKSEIQEDVKKK